MEANFSVMTTIPICPRPRAVDGSFPEFPIDTDTPALVVLHRSLFSGGPIYKLFKNPNPSLIENQRSEQKYVVVSK